MNQPWGCIHRLPLEPPSHLPPSHPLGHVRAWAKFPVSHSSFPLALCFIRGSRCVSASLSFSSSHPLLSRMFSSLFSMSETMTLSSVQSSHSIMSDSLWPHALQHARPPCPSPTPGVYPNPCPLSWWCHPTISSSVVPFSSHPQSFPASGSFKKIMTLF